MALLVGVGSMQPSSYDIRGWDDWHITGSQIPRGANGHCLVEKEATKIDVFETRRVHGGVWAPWFRSGLTGILEGPKKNQGF